MLSSFLATTGTILLAAVGVSFLIFIHELGHFLAARRVGIRVETFSIGFGPPIANFRRGGTDYRIAWIPLGGYVKMAGETPADAKTGAPDEFASKSVSQRMQVIMAGVVMNALFAVPAFILAFSIGVRFPVPRVGAVQTESPAARAGLERGDRILSIDGKEINTFLGLHEAVAVANPESGLSLVYRRAGETREVTVQPRPAGAAGIQTIGVRQLLEVTRAPEGSPAAEAGLERGDVILAVDGEPIEDERAFENRMFGHPGETFTVTVERGPADERVRREVEITVGARPAVTLGLRLDPHPVVHEVTPDGPADAAGLEAGDSILSIGGEEATRENLRELVRQVGESGEEGEFVIRRPEEEEPITLAIRPEERGGHGWLIGLAFGGTNRVAEVRENGPAAEIGIEAGDLLTRVGPLQANAIFEPELTKYLNDRNSRPEPTASVEVAWRTPGGEERSARASPAVREDEEVGWTGLAFGPAMYVRRSSGVGEAIWLGFERTWATVRLIYRTVEGLVLGRISANALGGPVMISYVAYRWTQLGFGTLLYFLALLSMNLAILNILPVPILDGGHVVFLTAEWIRGEPVPEYVLGYAQWLGLIILLGLMIFVTMNDILRFL